MSKGQISCPTPEDAATLDRMADEREAADAEAARKRREAEAARKKQEAEEKKKAQQEEKFKADAPARKKVSELLKDDVLRQRTADLQKSAAVQNKEMQKFLAEYGPRSANCQLVAMGWGAAAGTQCALQELQAKANATAPAALVPNSPEQVRKELEALAQGQPAASAAAPAAPTAITKQQYDYLKANAAMLKPEQRTIPNLAVVPPAPNMAVCSTFSGPLPAECPSGGAAARVPAPVEVQNRNPFTDPTPEAVARSKAEQDAKAKNEMEELIRRAQSQRPPSEEIAGDKYIDYCDGPTCGCALAYGEIGIKQRWCTGRLINKRCGEEFCGRR